MASRPFKIFADLEAFEKSGDEHPMRIGGIVSTDELDFDNEVLVQEGLDFAPFLQSGWFNDNHSDRMSDVLGYPVGAQLVKPGDTLPNGKVAETKGWWAEGYLLNTQRGRETWELAEALKGTERHLGFSIEGAVQARDRRNPKTVLRGVVKHVAITHVPKNTGTHLEALAKALSAGHAAPVAGAAGTPGDGSALRAEDLESKLSEDDKRKKKQRKAEDDKAKRIAKALGLLAEHPPTSSFLKEWSSDILQAARVHARLHHSTLTQRN